MKKLSVHHLNARHFFHATFWSVFASGAIVAAAAAIGRATVNLQTATVSKPDVAVYLLLPDEGVTSVEFLKGDEDHEREYLVQTKDGPKLVRLKKGEEEWFVAETEVLHE